jgi:hypothetical protein
MRRRPRLDAIDRDLRKAGRLLDSAAGKLRDANFAPGRNILRIAEALAGISKIQLEIYLAQPGLLPKYLTATRLGAKAPSKSPRQRDGMNSQRRSKRARAGRSTRVRRAQ